MPFILGLDLVKKAYEENQKDRLFEMWLVKYDHMTKDTYISFEDWYDELKTSGAKQVKVNNISKDDILEKVDAIRSKAVGNNEHI